MKRGVCITGAMLLLSAADARAFRPFDGTDAAVAETGQLEIELGPLQYRRDGSAHSLIAPATVFNYGFAPGWEGVVEGNVAYGLAGGVAGTSLSSAGASLKGVQRWPGEFGQRAKWIFCLMTARIAADQERA